MTTSHYDFIILRCVDGDIIDVEMKEHKNCAYIADQEFKVETVSMDHVPNELLLLIPIALDPTVPYAKMCRQIKKTNEKYLDIVKQIEEEVEPVHFYRVDYHMHKIQGVDSMIQITFHWDRTDSGVMPVLYSLVDAANKYLGAEHMYTPYISQRMQRTGVKPKLLPDWPIENRLYHQREILQVPAHSTCQTCKKPQAKHKCSVCRFARYCSKECQKKDWKNHKKTCREVVDTFTEFAKQ
jgi:hypothetical protein